MLGTIMLATCNMMTMSGFDKSIGGAGTMAWIGAAIVFFLIALSNKWLFEEFEMPFNAIFAYVVGLLAYFITVSLTCAPKWALLAGIAGALVGGMGIGAFIGGSND